eukprot:TRINITY_DN16437_c0_g1_i1.p1 TRINITY_DN16437_c0_g1~~TRINITY_DN16437_c0_g1_i1.p1  ORF type:complete len:367 (-),score=57.24 TRINITY_DN16437_c0_g1_i1:254-1354(-)
MYWLISLPWLSDSQDATWRTLQHATANGDLSQNSRFDLPMGLRVGSLDTLMVLSDDLARVNIMAESVVNKIRRQASELVPDEALQVNNRPVSSYLTSFAWDEAKYPLRKPLQDIVKELNESASGIDDELKVKMAEYASVKQQFQALNRKQGGSLAVKDVRTVVPKELVVDTENMMTMVVTVNNRNRKDFVAQYEGFSEMVVPRSAKIVAEDDDMALVRVVVFRRVAEDFKQAARLKGFTSREYVPADTENDASTTNSGPDREAIAAELESKRSELGTWCRTSYGDAFTNWIHVCAVRLFVESVLRYGLPPKFQGVLMQPEEKYSAKLRKELAQAFGTFGAEFWTTDDDNKNADVHPYVSFTLDIET